MNDHLTEVAPPTVFIYGPQGCGKTRNAAALREHFGCMGVVDDFNGDRRSIEEGALHLCPFQPEFPKTVTRGTVVVYPFDVAMEFVRRAAARVEQTARTRTSKGLGTNRTDFKNWKRETLELFARQAADENLVLRERLFELETDGLPF